MSFRLPSIALHFYWAAVFSLLATEAALAQATFSPPPPAPTPAPSAPVITPIVPTVAAPVFHPTATPPQAPARTVPQGAPEAPTAKAAPSPPASGQGDPAAATPGTQLELEKIDTEISKLNQEISRLEGDLDVPDEQTIYQSAFDRAKADVGLDEMETEVEYAYEIGRARVIAEYNESTELKDLWNARLNIREQYSEVQSQQQILQEKYQSNQITSEDLYAQSNVLGKKAWNLRREMNEAYKKHQEMDSVSYQKADEAGVRAQKEAGQNYRDASDKAHARAQQEVDRATNSYKNRITRVSELKRTIAKLEVKRQAVDRAPPPASASAGPDGKASPDSAAAGGPGSEPGGFQSARADGAFLGSDADPILQSTPTVEELSTGFALKTLGESPTAIQTTLTDGPGAAGSHVGFENVELTVDVGSPSPQISASDAPTFGPQREGTAVLTEGPSGELTLKPSNEGTASAEWLEMEGQIEVSVLETTRTVLKGAKVVVDIGVGVATGLENVIAPGSGAAVGATYSVLSNEAATSVDQGLEVQVLQAKFPNRHRDPQQMSEYKSSMDSLMGKQADDRVKARIATGLSIGFGAFQKTGNLTLGEFGKAAAESGINAAGGEAISQGIGSLTSGSGDSGSAATAGQPTYKPIYSRANSRGRLTN